MYVYIYLFSGRGRRSRLLQQLDRHRPTREQIGTFVSIYPLSLSIHLYLCIYIYFDNIHLYVCMYIFIYLAAVVDAAVCSNNWIVIDRLGSKSVRLCLSIYPRSVFLFMYLYFCIYVYLG